MEIVTVQLEPPRGGEVLVRLHASGVCHSDENAIDGTSPTRCPAVLGHEGSGVVEAIGMSVEGPDAKAAARLVARGDAISSPFHGGK